MNSTQHSTVRLLCLLSAVCYLLASGCVHRSLTIRSEPPGALVYIDDQLKGPTPVSYDFLWYGWHRVMLRKDGYQRVEEHRLLRAPAHLWIPCDLVMELMPWSIHDDKTWSYTLTKAEPLPTPVPPPIVPAQPQSHAPPKMPTVGTPSAPPAASGAEPAAASSATRESRDASP